MTLEKHFTQCHKGEKKVKNNVIGGSFKCVDCCSSRISGDPDIASVSNKTTRVKNVKGSHHSDCLQTLETNSPLSDFFSCS